MGIHVLSANGLYGTQLESKRMLRDGWHVGDEITADTLSKSAFKENSSERRETLHVERKYQTGYQRKYMLETRSGMTALDGADWADYDQHGRLVYSKQGMIWVRMKNGIHKQLADFNELRYRRLPTPEHATTW